MPAAKVPLYAEQERMLADIMMGADSLGNVPVLIGGDMNTNGEYSAIIRHLINGPRWKDAAQAIAEVTGNPPDDTCYTAHGKPSRPDILLLNAAAQAALVGVRIHNDSPLAVHRPITFSFNRGH